MICRCPICNTVEGEFVLDPHNKDYVCLDCANSIQDASESDWAEVGEADEFCELDSW
jgi:transcription initiation factor TFIIIB Brf1 subunit/transcription initiation factor TFIIB